MFLLFSFLFFFFWNKPMRDIVFITLFSLLVGGTEGPSVVPKCADTQSSIVLWLY